MDKLKEHLKELCAQRDIINNTLREKEQAIAETEQAIAELACPFNVGDMVRNGKGEKEIIASIRYRPFHPFYALSVFKLKKDGTPYKRHHSIYWTEKYSLA